MRKIVLFLSICGRMAAQTPEPPQKVEFEVASIHPAKEDGDHDSDSDRAWYRTHNLTLKRLIAIAYDVDMRQILGGPNWIDSDAYDIAAKIPTEYASDSREKMPKMIQSLLADRFHLAIHRAPLKLSGYALVLAKKGPKMERSETGKTGSSTSTQRGHMRAQNVTMEIFAKRLSRNPQVGKLVEDQTGLKDRYNFELEWDVTNPLTAKADTASSDRPSIFTALQDRLGLKLEPAKIQVDAIVVDHAEKPDDN